MVRPPVDDRVDRPQLQGARAPQASGTNRPSSSHIPSSGRHAVWARSVAGVPRRSCTLCSRQGARTEAREGPGGASDHGGGGTPGPVPNPAVKPSIAESTAGAARGRVGRRWPRRGPRAFGGPGRVFRQPDTGRTICFVGQSRSAFIGDTWDLWVAVDGVHPVLVASLSWSSLKARLPCMCGALACFGLRALSPKAVASDLPALTGPIHLLAPPLPSFFPN